MYHFRVQWSQWNVSGNVSELKVITWTRKYWFYSTTNLYFTQDDIWYLSIEHINACAVPRGEASCFNSQIVVTEIASTTPIATLTQVIQCNAFIWNELGTESSAGRWKTTDYHQTSNTGRTRYKTLHVSRLVLQLSLSNPFKRGIKSRMKMQLEQRRQAMPQKHLGDQQLIAY